VITEDSSTIMIGTLNLELDNTLLELGGGAPHCDFPGYATTINSMLKLIPLSCLIK